VELTTNGEEMTGPLHR